MKPRTRTIVAAGALLALLAMILWFAGIFDRAAPHAPEHPNAPERASESTERMPPVSSDARTFTARARA